MNFRTTTLLFGILLGTLWVFGLILAWKKSSDDEGYLLPRMVKDNPAINYVEIAKGGKNYIFTKTPGGWRLKVPPHEQDVRVDDKRIDDLIDEIRTSRHSPDTDINASAVKLDAPETSVTLKDTSTGAEAQFNVVGVSPDKAYAYINSSERKREVLVVKYGSVGSLFFDNINDFRSRRLLEANEFSTAKIDLQEPKDGKMTSVLSLKRSRENRWQFVKPPLGPADYEGSPVAKQDHSVRSLIVNLTSLRAEEFEPIGTGVTFDEKNAKLRIEIDTDGGKGAPGKKDAKAGPVTKEVLLIGDKVRGEEKYFARLLSDNSVVQVGAKQLEPVFELMKDPRPLRSRDVAQFDEDKADAVEVVRGKEFVKLFKKDDHRWKVFSSDNPPRDGDFNAILGPSGILSSIQGKREIGEKDFADMDAPDKVKKLEEKFAPDKVQAVVRVWVDSLQPEDKKEPAKQDAKKDEKKDEKKDGKKDETAVPKLKADAKPVVTLSFVTAGDKKVLVKRETPDSEPMYFELKSEVYEKIAPPEMALSFYDTKIESFNPFEAIKLELLRGTPKDQEKFLLEKEDKDKKDKKDEPKKDEPKGEKDTKKTDKETKKDEKETKKDEKDTKKDDKEAKKDEGAKKSDWKLIEPKGFEGKGAGADDMEVRRVLMPLANLQADRWVRKVATEDKLRKEQLAEYGLDAPNVVVSVTYKKREEDKDADKKPGDKKEPDKKEAKEEIKTFKLLVGNKSRNDRDKEGVYAMVDGTDLVFVLRSSTDKTLKDAEFRDRQVMKFDASQAISLQGYILDKEEVEVRDPLFERGPDKNWKIVRGTTVKLDPSRVDEIVRKMSDLRVVRYLKDKMPGLPSYRLTGDKVPLKFEVTLDDGKNKTKHWLTIGAEEQKGGPYYASCDALPDVIFLVPRELFEGVMKDKVAWFQR